MCPADLAPDHTRTFFFAAGNAVDICDALAEIPLRVLRAVDAFERKEAHVGVCVAFAALVAGLVDCALLVVDVGWMRECQRGARRYLRKGGKRS